ncbi:acyclic terpene utilization AtuA family protein [Ruegeria sp. 2205SS24-7]|uniref:acyclic terpene utilization AtuA family protein n=1 Tax=Ruegeria discodermiae TaxID=3064389 RepID=UPI0027417FF7|nr:acyclic terpene utilization AtuA family protein [Ruegeria sp. 2205SS24-7]MDP5219336.1 acyclic terpene utilization AtuA family protein [Ruegeria sp. 2205SS24-7]
MAETLRIGGACGFWGEAPHATAQLLAGGVDFLVYDYLAEITMSLLARAKARDADAGYAPDFVTDAVTPNLTEITKSGVKLLSNAGGMNPVACADAVRAAIDAAGVSLRVAVVEGDDILPRAEDCAGVSEMFSGAALPQRDRIASMNAYLGALPVVAALRAGADIVITGRCADSALTLAACIWRFDWPTDSYDLLAAGSLTGHLLECGPQATGGNFTDWEAAGDLARIGYPIAEVAEDGSILLSKPQGTTGTVTRASVGEQMLYEIGDPRAYLLPDVICDFSRVALTQAGPDRVSLTGARGHPPSGQLKVCATYQDGYRGGMVFQMNGRDAGRKARAFAQAGLDRARDRLRDMGAPDFTQTAMEAFGGHPNDGSYEEIAFKAAVRHPDARAVGLFLKELTGTALATPPGLHFFTGAGRPKPSPVVALFSFLIDARDITCRVTLDGDELAFAPDLPSLAQETPEPAPQPPAPETDGDQATVPLEQLAWARSGDKGDSANIGVIARHPDALPHIWAALSAEAIEKLFEPELRGEVQRYFLPGSHSMNIVMTRVLGGGGIASLRNDPQGKSFAQRLLSLPIAVPASLIHRMEGGAE